MEQVPVRYRYAIQYARTDPVKNSNSVRTVASWNRLPDSVADPGSESQQCHTDPDPHLEHYLYETEAKCSSLSTYETEANVFIPINLPYETQANMFVPIDLQRICPFLSTYETEANMFVPIYLSLELLQGLLLSVQLEQICSSLSTYETQANMFIPLHLSLELL